MRAPKIGTARTLALATAIAAMTAAPLAEALAQKYPGTRMPGVSNNPGRMPTGPRPSGGGGRGPNWGGVATGIGIGIAAGAIIGAATAHANQPPPPGYDGPPPPRRGNPPPPRPTAALNIPPQSEMRYVPDEVVMEFGTAISPQQMNALAARHRLTRLESEVIPLTQSTFFRARITDGRPVPTVLRAIGREAQLRAAQPNYRYTIQQQAEAAMRADPAPGEPSFVPHPAETPAVTPVLAPAGALPAALGDPAQYALAKLRLGEAHGLAKGKEVLVAVIDSGIDMDHPELKGTIAGSFDTLESLQKSHPHGTAMAGAIAANARLMGVAPAARILAIRAFGAPDSKADGTTFAIVRSLAHAAEKGARVINMSFAGPADPAVSRQLAAARGKGIVLVAAAGNAGPNAKPLYPAADPNVIAVTATDANDTLFKQSNRGRHVAVAAPGVDILVPAPEANYQVTSGTSVAAAHVSGIAALLLERKPGLSPDAVRDILMRSAKDLGPRGRDDQYGAGLADAYQAMLSLEPRAAAR